jgi:uncharacterized membrane protein YiaA
METTQLDIVLVPVIILVAVWSLFWKILALWHAARANERGWFIAMLILNTAGVLEIIYLFAVAKVKTNDAFKLK